MDGHHGVASHGCNQRPGLPSGWNFDCGYLWPRNMAIACSCRESFVISWIIPWDHFQLEEHLDGNKEEGHEEGGQESSAQEGREKGRSEEDCCEKGCSEKGCQKS